jgi:hypothetical protein
MKVMKVNLELREEVKKFLINYINGSCDGWEEGECDLNIDLEEGMYFEGKELELGLELRDIIGDNKLIGELKFNSKFKVEFFIEKTDDLLLEGIMNEIK